MQTEMTNPITNPSVRRFAFLWDSWSNEILIRCGSDAAFIAVPEGWIFLNGARPISAAHIPPLGALAAFLQTFNHLDSDNFGQTHQILGTAENTSSEWRRTQRSEEELTPPVESAEAVEVHEDILCAICQDKLISIQFRECTHALCVGCNEGYWWALIAGDIAEGRGPDNSLRLSFPCHMCHMCRAQIFHQGLLVRDNSSRPAEIRHGQVGFSVEGWHLVGLKPGFKFHQVFIVWIEDHGHRILAEPLVSSRERLMPVIDGQSISWSWDLYVAFALRTLSAMVRAENV